MSPVVASVRPEPIGWRVCFAIGIVLASPGFLISGSLNMLRKPVSGPLSTDRVATLLEVVSL